MSFVQSLCNIALEGRFGNEVLVDPALISDVGEQCVEQSQVGARLDRQIQHVVLASFHLAGVDRHGAAGIDDNNLGTFPHAWNHVIEEQVCLRL